MSRYKNLIAAYLLVLVVLGLDVGFGTQIFFSSTRAIVIQFNEKAIYLRDPEGGGRERNVLFGKVSYSVEGFKYVKDFHITEDFWESFNKYQELKSSLKQGTLQIQVFSLIPSHYWISKPSLIANIYFVNLLILIISIIPMFLICPQFLFGRLHDDR